MSYKIIAIDFDGVLAASESAKDIHPKAVVGAIAAVHKLRADGHRLYVLTGRKEFEPIREWLIQWGIRDMEVTNVKRFFHIFLDDHGYAFKNWEDALKEIYDTKT